MPDVRIDQRFHVLRPAPRVIAAQPFDEDRAYLSREYRRYRGIEPFGHGVRRPHRARMPLDRLPRIARKILPANTFDCHFRPISAHNEGPLRDILRAALRLETVSTVGRPRPRQGLGLASRGPGRSRTPYASITRDGA